MKNLADIVLDYLWFLEFTEDDDLAPDVAVKALENVSYQIEHIFSASEKTALSEMAARRLEEQRGTLTDSQREFLKVIADGDFNGSPDEEES